MATTTLGTSYDFGFAAGSANREDLTDVIVNIAPWETPFFSSCPKIPIRHTTHEWLEDTLAAASANPYSATMFEGADFSQQTMSVRVRKNNITQIFRKDIKVSETQRAVNPAGVRDEYQYQIEIAMKELARHVETQIFNNASTNTATGGITGATGTYRQFSPLQAFITTNLKSAGSSAASVGCGKAAIDVMIEACFIAGGTPARIYCHPNGKTNFANALGGSVGFANYRNIAATDARIIGNIDAYMSNFGLIEIVPDRFIPTGSTTATAVGSASLSLFSGVSGGKWWLIDQPKAKMGFLRPVKHVPLPPAGDAVRGMVLGELTLVVEAESAHGQAVNIITA